MTRINAGNTLANQYAPPFVITDSIATSWQLRWNADLIAFEAYDPSENVVVTGFDSIESALFTDVTQQVFIVPWEAATKESLVITKEGVKQQQDEYTSVTNAGSGSTTITLLNVVSVETVEILGLQTSGGATIEVFLETAIAAQTTFPIAGSIGWYPASEQSLIITLDGLKQNTTAYSIVPDATFTGAQIELVVAPGAGVVVEVIGIVTAGETPASPVEFVNLSPSDVTLFSTKRVAGETQFFDIKGLTEGTNITLTASGSTITIDADIGDFANVGSGVPIANIPGTVNADNEIELKRLFAGDRIVFDTSQTLADTVVIDYNLGYKAITDTASPYTVLAAERLIVITSLAAVISITLQDPSTLSAGETITVKNQTTGTSAITLTPAAGLIDGAATYVINTAYGYITLYSDGTNYFIISEG